MRLQRVALVVLLLVLSTPAFAARNSDGPSLYDRIAALVQRLVLRVIVPSGDGLIGPIPNPNPNPNP